jgi:hypothetical protein
VVALNRRVIGLGMSSTPEDWMEQAMEQRPLGRTGVTVSQLCLGAMMFGAWGNPDHDESICMVHTALDAGINFLDTADVYGAGESEEILGKALAGGCAPTGSTCTRCTGRTRRPTSSRRCQR